MGNSLQPTFKLDAREFNEAMRQSAYYSKRSTPEIVNTAMFYAARGSVRGTPKADAQAIRQELGVVGKKEIGQKIRILKSGRVKRGRMVTEKVYASSDVDGVSFAEAILRAREAKKGTKRLSHDEMLAAVQKFVANRLRSVAFLKSGWLPAIARLGAAIGQTARGAGKMYQNAKGSGTPAKQGWSVRAVIENAAGANRNNKGALFTYGQPALEKAFGDEQRKIEGYVETHMRRALAKAGVKA